MKHSTHRARGLGHAMARAGAALLALGAALCVHPQDKSGLGADHVILPNGPGSVGGYGPDYDKDLPSGSASLSIPIEVPRGVAGFNPELNLAYDSGGGAGTFGWGWDMELNLVERRNGIPLPRYVDGPNGQDDDFDGDIDEDDEQDQIRAYDGGWPINLISEDDLDPEDDLEPQGNGYFFTSIENDFIRYEQVDDYWRGVKPDGYAIEFGLTPQSRVFDPANPDKVFSWSIEREHDLSGNVIEYYYVTADPETTGGNTNLSEIRWGVGEPPWDNFHFVKFNFEARPDAFESGVPGFIIREYYRVTSIVVGTQTDELPGHLEGDFNQDGTPDFLNRRYDLKYEAHPFWSLLSSVTMVGADGVTAMPATTFTYRICDPPQTIDASAAGIVMDHPPVTLPDSPGAAFTELNGDGLPDMLVTNPAGGAHKAYLNLGERLLSGARAVGWSDPITIGGDSRAWTVDLANDDTIGELVDMNGDGRADLAWKAGPFESYYFPQQVETGEVRWGERQKMNLFEGYSAPPSPFETDNVAHSDFNGDKKLDVCQTIGAGATSALKIWYNLDEQKFSKPVTKPLPFNWLLSQEGVDITDYNGDGIDDFVRIRSNRIEVWPGLGYGNYGAMRTALIPDYTLLDRFIDAAELEDVTGDGFPELMIKGAEPGVLWYWVGHGNYTFENRREITGLPVPTGFNPTLEAADVNGNGSDDLVFIDSGAAQRMVAVDIGELIGCVPAPNLMVKVENGYGRSTGFQYDVSTSYLLADAAAGKPWFDPLPFPVEVVKEVRHSDGIGPDRVEQLDYGNGFYDPRFKAFAGFGDVVHTEVGQDAASTAVNRYTFDVGKASTALRGVTLKQRLEDGAGNLQWEERTSWEIRQLGEDAGTSPIEVGFPIHIMRDIREGGNGTLKQLEKEFLYDNYGNVVQERDYGIVENGDRRAYNDEVITVTEHAINLDDWLVRYPKRVEIQDLSRNVVSRTETYYDDDTFSGENLGETIWGGQTLEKKWYDPADPDGYVISQRCVWGDYGNIEVFLDALAAAPGGEIEEAPGHYRDVVFDDKFQTWPVVETIHLGGEDEKTLTLEADYDVGFGVVTASRDYSGNETTYAYDALARPIGVQRPGDDPAFPSVQYRYSAGVHMDDAVVNYVETRLLDKAPNTDGLDEDGHYRITRTYQNGYGETVQEREEAEPNPETGDPRVAVTNTTLYDARGKASVLLNPFYTIAGGALEDQLAFENVQKPGWAGIFQQGPTLTALDLAAAHKVTTTYDAQQRPRVVTLQDGKTRETRYEPLVVKQYDENDTDPASPAFDTPLVHYRDGQDRIMQVDEMTRLNDDGTPGAALHAWTTHYDYREDGVRTGIIDSQNNTRHFEYDGMRRIVGLNDPNLGQVSYAYDEASNMVERTDAKGQVTRFSYDNANRKLTEDYLDDGEPFSLGYSYDPAEPLDEGNRPDIAYFYDEPVADLALGDGSTGTATNVLGHLAYVWDQAGEAHSSYDERGRLAWSVRSLRDPRSNLLTPYQTRMEYDAMDRVTAVHYPDGDTASYAYNERNLAERIGAGPPSGPLASDLLRAAAYAPNGQRTSAAYGNGISVAFGHDARKRLTSLRSIDAARNVLLDYQYGYDNASNITQITDGRPESALPVGDKRRNHQGFAYDDMARLALAGLGHGPLPDSIGADGSITYRYDRIGNLLAQTSDIDDRDGRFSRVNIGTLEYGGAQGASNRDGRAPGDSPGPSAATFQDDGFFTRAFGYDENGCMTNIGDLQLTWNFAHQLAAAENGAMRAEYMYDHSGERVLKSVYAKTDGVPADVPEVTQYVAKYFEVREGEQPVKYVYDGETRLARVLGTMDPGSERVQRFRFASGWNLTAIGVETPDAATQLGIGLDPAITGAYSWDALSASYVEVDENAALPGGTVLWVYAEQPLHAVVHGMPVAQDAQAGAVAGFNALRALHAARADSTLGDTLRAAWAFNADAQEWHARFGGDAAFLSDFPDFIGAGQPVFLALDDPATLNLGGEELDLQYYIPDHLGSAQLLTGADGAVIEETAYYPYGETRNIFAGVGAAATLPGHYGFSQKERDAESGLHYFEARYLASQLARFTRVDPVVEALPDEAIADPQLLNAYAYARNNPIAYTDPDGKFIKTKAGQVLARQFNPFSDQASGNLQDNKFLRRARVFGQLKVDKGGTLFSGGGQAGAGSIPDFAAKEIDKLKADFLKITPNEFISNIEKAALQIKRNTKDPKLDVDQFLNAITQKADSRGDLGKSLLQQFGQLGADPKNLKDSPITESGSIVNEGIAKQIGALQNTLKGLDLQGKLKELTDKGNEGLKFKDSQGFNFSQKQIDDFMDKYLGGADKNTPLNRGSRDKDKENDDSRPSD